MATIAQSRRNVGAALVFLLGTAVFLNYVDRGAISIAAPKLKDELGLSAEAYGLVFSAFFWIYAPVQFFAGWLCDRFSVYRLMAIGIMIWAGATLLMGFAGGFLSLLVLRVMLSPTPSMTRSTRSERKPPANPMSSVAPAQIIIPIAISR